MISLALVLLTIAVVAVVRRKISRASNSPSSQLELINSQKQDLDYSPDIIPKDSGIIINRLILLEIKGLIPSMTFFDVAYGSFISY